MIFASWPLNLKLMIGPSRRGFTMIEVLVVIAIMSVFSGIGYVTYDNSQNKGRDARRKEDLKQIKTALVSYYQDKYVFPPASTTDEIFSSDTGNNWIPDLADYMPKIPKDPKQAGITTGLASLFNRIGGAPKAIEKQFAPKPQVAATVSSDFYILSSGDDLMVWPGSMFSSTNTVVRLGTGSTGGDYSGAFRFQNINIPKGSTITAAYIKFKSLEDNAGTTVNSKIRAEAADNATQITSYANYYARTRTSAQITQTLPTWYLNTWYQSLDIKSVVQEVINRSGWASGNAVNIFWENNSSTAAKSRAAYSYDQGASYAAILHVEYTIPDADLTITDFHLTDASGNTKTTFAPSEQIHPSVTIKNNGTGAATGSSGFFFVGIYSNKPSDVAVGLSSDIGVWVRETGSIAAGTSKTYSVTENSSFWTNSTQTADHWSMATPGSYTARAFVDSFNYVSETDETATSNQKTSAYTVAAASPSPSATPIPTISCSISPTTLAVGQDLTISATITNTRSTNIQTQGPESGHVYREGESYNTAPHNYPDINGRFRMTADLQGEHSYPYRWGWGAIGNLEPTLSPAGVVNLNGKITMQSTGTKTFQVGLVEEQIAWRALDQCQTIVTVTPAPPSPTPLGKVPPCSYYQGSNVYGYGDVDSDGAVSWNDKQLIAEFIAGTKTPDSLQTILANVSNSGGIDNADVTEITNFLNGGAFSFTVCASASPGPSATPAPSAATPTICDNKTHIYCYVVTQDRTTFVLWAQLDNLNDPEIYTKSTAACQLSSPPGTAHWNLNYCVRSPT